MLLRAVDVAGRVAGVALVRVAGRAGTDGVVDEDEAVAVLGTAAVEVGIAVDAGGKADAAEAPPRSQGFGGEGIE